MASGPSATDARASASAAGNGAGAEEPPAAANGAGAVRHIGVPPGPRAPNLIQTLTWALAPTWMMDRCAERLGEAFTITFFPSGMQLVMISDPEAVKTLFTAPPEI